MLIMAALHTVPPIQSVMACSVPATVPSQTANITPSVSKTKEKASPWVGTFFSMPIASKQVKTGMDALQSTHPGCQCNPADL